MGRALALRDDFSGSELRRLARELRDADQTRRLLALAVIYDGGSRVKGKGAGLVMPWRDTAAMNAHLEEISAMVAPGAHALLILDPAGWHLSCRKTSPSCRCRRVRPN
jgi:hypothetical protein